MAKIPKKLLRICKSFWTGDVSTLACEKQIPKKPLLGGNTDKLTGDIFICPSCCGIVGIDDVRGYYCADCGQKLDWENEDLKE